MILYRTGNLFDAQVDALVNPVNTVGVMGKGLALQFKRAFPECFREYEAACKRGDVRVGKVHVHRRSAAPRFVLNLPTKQHWRDPSRLDFVREGLVDLVAQVEALGIESIAVPALGCGNGGLAWLEVEPLIVSTLSPLVGVRVLLFVPGEHAGRALPVWRERDCGNCRHLSGGICERSMEALSGAELADLVDPKPESTDVGGPDCGAWEGRS